jgi:hypothetical protein
MGLASAADWVSGLYLRYWLSVSYVNTYTLPFTS